VPSELPRRYKATYASSMAGEIRKNVQLEPGEEVVYWCSVQVRTNWFLMQPGVLQLTARRLILVEHHAFSADWILEIPRAAIGSVTATGDSGSDWTAISFSGVTGVETVNLRPLAFRGRPSPQQSGVLLDALRTFHGGELSRNAIANSEKQRAAAAGPPSYSSVALLALLGVVLFLWAGIYITKFPEEWRAKQAYDASSDCNPAHLLAPATLDRMGPLPAQSSIGASAGAFCLAQTMTVLRVWSTHNAPYQHVDLMDSSGKEYYDIGALNSVNTNLWWRMRVGVKVYVLLAGNRPAWILHDGDLFETRESPDHNFWEQSELMLACFFFCGVVAALTVFVLRRTMLARRHAALAQGSFLRLPTFDVSQPDRRGCIGKRENGQSQLGKR